VNHQRPASSVFFSYPGSHHIKQLRGSYAPFCPAFAHAMTSVCLARSCSPCQVLWRCSGCAPSKETIPSSKVSLISASFAPTWAASATPPPHSQYWLISLAQAGRSLLALTLWSSNRVSGTLLNSLVWQNSHASWVPPRFADVAPGTEGSVTYPRPPG
jgi:hypothetical protein